MTKVCGLLNCFAALFLGRALDEKEFQSTSSIRNWIKRLTLIDKHRTAELDQQTFGFKSEHGFPVLYYIVPDVTTHAAHDKRHGMIRTGVYDDGTPKYLVMTSGKALT